MTWYRVEELTWYRVEELTWLRLGLSLLLQFVFLLVDESGVWNNNAAHYIDCDFWWTLASLFLIKATNSNGNDYRK